MDDEKLFRSRLAYSGDLFPVVRRACAFFALPEPRSMQLFTTGFENYSMKIDVGSKEAWVLKIFSKEATLSDISRYNNIVRQAVQGGVNHPVLRSGLNREIIYTDLPSDMHMVMVEYIPGILMKNVTSIPENIFKKVINEAVKISTLPIRPLYRFDMWQVDNIEWLYNETKHILHSDVRSKIEHVINNYLNIVDSLPRGFIHGDMTRTNVIARSDKKGEVSILDFGSAGVYPRIRELSIIAVHFLADGTLSLSKCIRKVCDEFVLQGGLLSDIEQDSMLVYAQAILATKYMCNVYQIDKSTETGEMAYWRNASIIYLMSDSDTETPKRFTEKYAAYYSPDMWIKKP